MAAALSDFATLGRNLSKHNIMQHLADSGWFNHSVNTKPRQYFEREQCYSSQHLATSIYLYNDQLNAQVLIYLSIYFCLTCFRFLLAHLNRQVYSFGRGSNLLDMVSAPQHFSNSTHEFDQLYYHTQHSPHTIFKYALDVGFMCASQ
jgi:hypothetical protein